MYLLCEAAERGIALMPPTEELTDNPQPGAAFVFSQAQVGPYRCDFAIASADPVPRVLFIECDGHDFHSSKESMAHDKKRDRFIQQTAPIIRFTGSEIYRDCKRCVGETLDFFDQVQGLSTATLQKINSGGV